MFILCLLAHFFVISYAKNFVYNSTTKIQLYFVKQYMQVKNIVICI